MIHILTTQTIRIDNTLTILNPLCMCLGMCILGLFGMLILSYFWYTHTQKYYAGRINVYAMLFVFN